MRSQLTGSCSDWFRIQTEDDTLQPIMDLLLNVAVFMWIGAVCPWETFRANEVIPFHRLAIIGILVLLLRRLPIILALRQRIPQIRTFRKALLTGFFGPIGISAVFYLFVTVDFLQDIQNRNPDREDCRRLVQVTLVTVWFLIVSSVVS